MGWIHFKDKKDNKKTSKCICRQESGQAVDWRVRIHHKVSSGLSWLSSSVIILAILEEIVGRLVLVLAAHKESLHCCLLREA